MMEMDYHGNFSAHTDPSCKKGNFDAAEMLVGLLSAWQSGMMKHSLIRLEVEWNKLLNYGGHGQWVSTIIIKQHW